jgi:hypothetical protein
MKIVAGAHFLAGVTFFVDGYQLIKHSNFSLNDSHRRGRRQAYHFTRTCRK